VHQLGGGRLELLAITGAIEGRAPPFCFDQAGAKFETGRWLAKRGSVGALAIQKQQRVGDIAAALGRHVLLNRKMLPAQKLEDGVDEMSFGLGLVGV